MTLFKRLYFYFAYLIYCVTLIIATACTFIAYVMTTIYWKLDGKPIETFIEFRRKFLD